MQADRTAGYQGPPNTSDLDAPTARRQLITYAFVSSSLDRSADLLTGLIPLFVPIAKVLEGKQFEPDQFAKELSRRYGISINPLAVEELRSRLLKAGLLKRSQPDRTGSTYNYVSAEIDLAEREQKIDDMLNNLIERFKLYVSRLSPIAKLEYTTEQVEDIFLDNIVREHISENLRDDPTQKEQEQTSAAPSLPYIVGRFVLDLERNHPELVDDLSQIRAAAIVSEVVLDLRQPPDRNRKFPNLRLYVDGPIVMGLLGLSGSDRQQNLSKMFDQIKKLRCGIYIFSHSVEEIQDMIQAVLHADPIARVGPFGDALRDGEILENYAREIQYQPDRFLKELEIQIDRTATIKQSAYSAYFDDGKLLSFKRGLLSWGREKARDRDAQSVAYIMRYRRGVKSNDPLKTNYIFLTENSALARISHEFCVSEHLLDKYQTGPVIPLRRFAALLWMVLGGTDERHELSRRQLLANCALAVRSTPDVVEEMIKTLAKVRAEMVPQIRILMTLPRSSRLAMDVTLGNKKLINDQNVDEVLSVVRRAAIEEETARFDAVLAEREGRIAVQNQDFRRRLTEVEADAKRELEELENTSRKTEEQKLGLLVEMQGLRREIDTALENNREIVSRVFANVFRRVRRTIFLIAALAAAVGLGGIGYAVFLVIGLWNAPSVASYVAAVSLMLLSSFSVVVIGRKAIRQLGVRVSRHLLLSQLRVLGLEKYLVDAAVDWELGVISWQQVEVGSSSHQLALDTAASGNVFSIEEVKAAAAKEVIVLVHGIRDFALWQSTIRATLERLGFRVELTNYGRLNLVEFLVPISYFRQRAIDQIWEQVRIIRQNYPSRSISFIAHSFGTYLVAWILSKEFDLQASRVIFCGSVLSYKFRFQQIQGRYTTPILNEVGTRDVWPAMAESITFGYGSAGTYGFRRPLVRDRWHNGARHGFFLSAEFCRTYWVPFLTTGAVLDQEEELQAPPAWVQIVSVLKIKYAILIGAIVIAYSYWGTLTHLSFR
jgi:hypothetical protein